MVSVEFSSTTYSTLCNVIQLNLAKLQEMSENRAVREVSQETEGKGNEDKTVEGGHDNEENKQDEEEQVDESLDLEARLQSMFK